MSFPRYPRYKDSGMQGLGDVPEHWKIAPLKTVSTHNDEVLDESTAPDAEIAYVDISSVDAISGIKTTEAMQFSAAPSRARRRVKHGDVIVSTVRTYLKAIARIREPAENLIVSTGFAVIRPRAALCPDFLGHLVSASFFVDEVISRSTGVSYPAISAHELVAIPVTVPPLAEQTRIAAFLDQETAKIDELIAEQQRLIELLKEKRQAVISHAVTKGLNPDAPMKPSGIEWLGDVPAHWTLKKIKHLARSIEQGWSPQCENFPVENENEWGVLKVGCVNGGTFDPSENKALPAELEPIPTLAICLDDLLISRANTRELVGSAAVAKQGWPNLMLCDKLYRVRFNPGLCCPWFASRFLGSTEVRGQIELAASGASSSMLNIGQSAIMELVVPTPEFEEQRAIVEFLDEETGKLDALTAEARRSIDLLQERRAALISAAVTGQIDVRAFAERQAA